PPGCPLVECTSTLSAPWLVLPPLLPGLHRITSQQYSLEDRAHQWAHQRQTCVHSAWSLHRCAQLESARRAGRSEEPRLNSSHVSISYAVFCLKKKRRLAPYALFPKT